MNLAVLGAQWGDEGKGKIVDLLTPHFSIVARYQGGHNAGHTVFVNGTKFILRLIPSGILHPGITCVIGNGVVVDPQALFAEIDELARNGIDVGDRIVDQRQGASDPAVSPRSRPAVGGAARRAEDRDDLARHRAGVRGQDRPARHPRRRSRRSGRPRAERARQRHRAQPARAGQHHGLEAGARAAAAACRADAADGPRRVGAADRGDARRASRSCSKARRARCSTSTTGPIPTSPRRTPRSAASAPASAFRPARSAACSAWPRRTRRASAKGRSRPSSPARWATGCARAAANTARSPAARGGAAGSTPSPCAMPRASTAWTASR